MAKKKTRTPGAKKSKTVDQAHLMDLAAIVSGRVQIRSLILAEVTATRSPSTGVVGKDAQVELGTEEIGCAVDAEEKRIVVTPSFRLDVRKVGQQAPTLSIQAKFVISYSLDKLDDLNQENVEAFAGTNAVYNVWPYWREFVQSTVARMGLPPLTIPVFRLPTSEETES
ncbi:MAG: hypothetical protein ACYC61_21155 [Isosphaeraceae bacterium]